MNSGPYSKEVRGVRRRPAAVPSELQFDGKEANHQNQRRHDQAPGYYPPVDNVWTMDNRLAPQNLHLHLVMGRAAHGAHTPLHAHSHWAHC